MSGIFDFLAWWHWWVFAVVFVILEIFSPAAFFMWMGFAAAITGVIVLVMPMSWEMQFLIFAALSVASILIGRTYFRRHPIESEQPILNERGQELIGRVATVDQAIVNGKGRIRLGETTWSVSGPDAPAGQRVRVTGAQGSVLVVELID